MATVARVILWSLAESPELDQIIALVGCEPDLYEEFDVLD